MQKTILSFILIIISIPLFSAEIQGKVLHSENNAPFEFVTVNIIDKNTQKSVGGALTDINGRFSILPAKSGTYILRVSFVGFKTAEREITSGNQKIMIPDILLEEDSKTLKEVEVVGQGSQMRFDIDKKVFSVDQNLASAGGSATEVLQNIPSVNVDNDGNISLRNNENVEVWINGRPSGLTAENRAQVLQQLPAESIEAIEVMTNPSAKFSPEGTAGVINLVMKKNRKAGYYGSVGAGAMLTNGNKLGASANASINYTSNKLDVYANLGYRKMQMEGSSITNRQNFYIADTTQLLQNQTDTQGFKGLFFRAGADYHLNNTNTIGVSGFVMAGNMFSDGISTYLLNDLKPSQKLKDYSRETSMDGKRPSFDVTIYHKIDFDKKGSNLITNVSYSTHNMDAGSRYIGKVTFPTYSQSDISQNGNNKNEKFELKSDYTKKFSNDDKLELGWFSGFEKRNSIASGTDNVTNTALDTYYNEFLSDEWIHAAYITYGKKINHFSAQLGLRGEYQYTHTNTISTENSLDTFPTNELQLFPSMYLSYSLPKNNEIQLNYTRRVNRPRGRQINSFRDYSDLTTVSFGNPKLTPEYASSFELNYLKSWDNHSIMTSAYYRYTTDVIQRVTYIEDNMMQSTFMNLTQQNNSGLEVVAKNRLFTVLNLTSSLNFYYSKINPSVYKTSQNVDVNISGEDDFTWNAKVIANFMLSKTFSGQITGEYIAPKVIGQGKQYEMYSIDFGLRKTFFDRKLVFALTGRDILNTRKVKTITSGAGFNQTYESLTGGRMGGGRVIGLSATYNFGNMKQKQGKQKNQGQDMEMNIEE